MCVCIWQLSLLRILGSKVPVWPDYAYACAVHLSAQYDAVRRLNGGPCGPARSQVCLGDSSCVYPSRRLTVLWSGFCWINLRGTVPLVPQSSSINRVERRSDTAIDHDTCCVALPQA
ncbi:hypothetical protein OH76DRAFT_863942 [Lentinus brumalis]|uniref:Secreted protein n=1 Tax=Lentinus brumalis TaxID=2498619 RepID=A0A371DRB3_9APHY|nr:hypothetical protein OH76DRAFT_863942 [Polyporus brumalis]